MKLRPLAMAAALMAAALLSVAPSPAAPARADTGVADVLDTLDSLGVSDIDPARAVSLGQSLCPMLADRAQNTADIAATLSDAIGRPLGVGTTFTGAAVSFLCPRAVQNLGDSLADGRPLLPLFG